MTAAFIVCWPQKMERSDRATWLEQRFKCMEIIRKTRVGFRLKKGKFYYFTSTSHSVIALPPIASVPTVIGVGVTL